MKDALDALDRLRLTSFEPMNAELRVECRDLERDQWDLPQPPPQRAWMIVRDPLPPSVDLALAVVDPIIATTAVAPTHRDLLAWTTRALEQRCAEPTSAPGWMEMYIHAVRVRIPDVERFAGRDTMSMDSEVGSIEVPLERDQDGLWVWGPDRQIRTQPPIEVAFLRDHDELFLTLSVHWSPWTTPGSAGEKAVREAVGQIEALGWKQDWPEALDD